MAGFTGASRKSGFRGGGNRPPVILLVGSVVCFIMFIALALVLFRKGEAKERVAAPKPAVRAAQPAVAAPPVDMVEVLVPVRNLDAGTLLDSSMLTKSLMPRAQVPANVVRLREEVSGMYARGILQARQPVLHTMITRERPANPLAMVIPEGFRAVSINVNALTGVEGWARAGARVDLQWISDFEGQPAIIPVIQNVKILSAERRLNSQADPGAPVPATVTLLVTERDAQKVSLTQGAGNLVLHLRGPGDNELIAQNANALTIRDLLSGSDKSLNNVLEGVAKIRKANGTYEEWAIVDGNLVRKNQLPAPQPPQP